MHQYNLACTNMYTFSIQTNVSAIIPNNIVLYSIQFTEYDFYMAYCCIKMEFISLTCLNLISATMQCHLKDKIVKALRGQGC